MVAVVGELSATVLVTAMVVGVDGVAVVAAAVVACTVSAPVASAGAPAALLAGSRKVPVVVVGGVTALMQVVVAMAALTAVGR